jgi:hypothetical protein
MLNAFARPELKETKELELSFAILTIKAEKAKKRRVVREETEREGEDEG